MVIVGQPGLFDFSSHPAGMILKEKIQDVVEGSQVQLPPKFKVQVYNGSVQHLSTRKGDMDYFQLQNTEGEDLTLQIVEVLKFESKFPGEIVNPDPWQCGRGPCDSLPKLPKIKVTKTYEMDPIAINGDENVQFTCTPKAF